MTTILKTFYQALDGKIFEDRLMCCAYEDSLAGLPTMYDVTFKKTTEVSKAALIHIESPGQATNFRNECHKCNSSYTGVNNSSMDWFIYVPLLCRYIPIDESVVITYVSE